jgi:hypothetical protein
MSHFGNKTAFEMKVPLLSEGQSPGQRGWLAETMMEENRTAT